MKRRKTVEVENIDQNIQDNEIHESQKEETEGFFAPQKKIKRDRYCSDLTNVTRSPAVPHLLNESNPSWGFKEDISNEKVEFCFDSGDMIDNDNSFGFIYNSETEGMFNPDRHFKSIDENYCGLIPNIINYYQPLCLALKASIVTMLAKSKQSFGRASLARNC